MKVQTLKIATWLEAGGGAKLSDPLSFKAQQEFLIEF